MTNGKDACTIYQVKDVVDEKFRERERWKKRRNEETKDENICQLFVGGEEGASSDR
jgi:hypothetical protein